MEKYNIGLRRPFTYHTLTLKSLPYALVMAKSDSGLIGLGEAALVWDVTGETQAGALAVGRLISPLLVGRRLDNISAVASTMSELNYSLAGNTGLKTGVESALFDILGKKFKKPIYQLLGGKKKSSVVLQKTFSYEELINDYESIIVRALKSGVQIFKFKIGVNLKLEADVLTQVRKKFPKIEIVVDANQTWRDWRLAEHALRAFAQVKIKWVEQPLLSLDFDGLALLRRKLRVPIMADESCHNLFHLKLFYEKRAIDFINIKLAKCGGLLSAKEMIAFCEQHKIGYMLGDMLHSALGTAYNLHAATLGNFLSYDLTLPERLRSDKARGLVFDGFKAYIPNQPGLGVNF